MKNPRPMVKKTYRNIFLYDTSLAFNLRTPQITINGNVKEAPSISYTL